jgi:hypothetical protein
MAVRDCVPEKNRYWGVSRTHHHTAAYIQKTLETTL